MRIKLVENIPLDTRIVAELIDDRDDLHLVWPLARWPFDHEQWQAVLDPQAGNKPFLVYTDTRLIGHAALRKKDEPGVYAVSFLYLQPDLRSGGLGEQMIGMLERYALTELQATNLTLVARTYNPRAIKCYRKCGFREYDREGTLIKMSKSVDSKGIKYAL